MRAPPVPHPPPPQPKPIHGPLSTLEPADSEVPAYLPVSHELRLPLNVGICKNCRRIFRSPLVEVNGAANCVHVAQAQMSQI